MAKKKEPVVTRTKEQIQQEYNTLAALNGEKNYHKALLEAEIAKFNNRMFELNQEMQQVTKAAT